MGNSSTVAIGQQPMFPSYMPGVPKTLVCRVPGCDEATWHDGSLCERHHHPNLNGSSFTPDGKQFVCCYCAEPIPAGQTYGPDECGFCRPCFGALFPELAIA
jgi:hypothetical protein